MLKTLSQLMRRPSRFGALAIYSMIYTSNLAFPSEQKDQPKDDHQEPQRTSKMERALSEDELARHLRFYQSISKLEVKFRQMKTIRDLDVQLKSEGKLTLTGQNQVLWEIEKPSQVKVFLNQEVIRVETGSGQNSTVQSWKLSDIPNDKDSKNLSGLMAWLQLDARALSQQYLISSIGNNQFRFKPRTSQMSAFKNLEMTLNSKNHLQTLIIHEQSGDEIQIHFSTPKVSRNT